MLCSILVLQPLGFGAGELPFGTPQSKRAHAITPHLGKGSNLALQDAFVLAACAATAADADGWLAAYSAERHLSARTPPTLLVHARDDRVVSPLSSRLYFDACGAHGVACTLVRRGGPGADPPSE